MRPSDPSKDMLYFALFLGVHLFCVTDVFVYDSIMQCILISEKILKENSYF
jgi:hypothetical protein